MGNNTGKEIPNGQQPVLPMPGVDFQLDGGTTRIGPDGKLIYNKKGIRQVGGALADIPVDLSDTKMAESLGRRDPRRRSRTGE